MVFNEETWREKEELASPATTVQQESAFETRTKVSNLARRNLEVDLELHNSYVQQLADYQLSLFNRASIRESKVLAIRLSR